MAKQTQETAAVEIPRLDIQMMSVRVVGDSPLITHAWSEKAKKQMLDKQMKKAKQGKEAKDPLRDYADSLYWLSDRPDPLTPDAIAQGRFGFPVVAFKAAAIGACRFIDGMKMTEARGAFHIVGEMAEIEGSPDMREDMVRVGMGTADIRYRGEFKKWATTLLVRFNATAFSPSQVINLLNTGGFTQGIGEWRPERGGSYGMFHVEIGGEK
jgi:hypothetical protein